MELQMIPQLSTQLSVPVVDAVEDARLVVSSYGT